MTIEFADKALQELYDTGTTRDKKYKKLCRDKKLVQGYINAVRAMYRTAKASDLQQLSYLHYERLKHRPESSIRILNGRVERLIFQERESGIIVQLIEIDNTHYGNR